MHYSSGAQPMACQPDVAHMWAAHYLTLWHWALWHVSMAPARSLHALWVLCTHQHVTVGSSQSHCSHSEPRGDLSCCLSPLFHCCWIQWQGKRAEEQGCCSLPGLQSCVRSVAPTRACANSWWAQRVHYASRDSTMLFYAVLSLFLIFNFVPLTKMFELYHAAKLKIDVTELLHTPGCAPRFHMI